MRRRRCFGPASEPAARVRCRRPVRRNRTARWRAAPPESQSRRPPSAYRSRAPAPTAGRRILLATGVVLLVRRVNGLDLGHHPRSDGDFSGVPREGYVSGQALHIDDLAHDQLVILIPATIWVREILRIWREHHLHE